MRLFFQYDAPLWRAISTIGDLILLNLLACLCALPVVTAGASFTALADTSRRLAAGEGAPVWRQFFASFRDNFKTSTLAWAVAGPIALALLAAWIFVQFNELIVLKVLLSAVYLLGFPFLWSLIARFENTAWAHLKNAWLLAIGNLPMALAVLAIHVAMIGVIVLTIYQLPQALPAVLLLGGSLPWVASAPLIERVFKPLLKPAP